MGSVGVDWIMYNYNYENALHCAGLTFLPTSDAVVKLREREGHRVDLGRSLKGHL